MPDAPFAAAPVQAGGAMPALERVPAAARALQAIAAETWKGVQIMWSFKFNLFGDVLGLFIIFLGINFFIGQGGFERDTLAFTLMGFSFWTFASFAIGNMSFALREEQQQGTIEQMCMGNTSFASLLLGRTLSNLLWSTLIIVTGGGVIALAFRLDLGLNLSVIPVLAISVLGLYGLGFLTGAATLLFKNILSFANLLQNVLLFLNGAIVPVTLFPAWMTAVARALPTTLGIEVTRLITQQGGTLQDAWNAGLLPLLIGHSTLWFAAGLGLFLFAERAARHRGLLGQF